MMALAERETEIDDRPPLEPHEAAHSHTIYGHVCVGIKGKKLALTLSVCVCCSG